MTDLSNFLRTIIEDDICLLKSQEKKVNNQIISQNRQVHHLLAGLSTTMHSNKALTIQEKTPENEIVTLSFPCRRQTACPQCIWFSLVKRTSI